MNHTAWLKKIRGHAPVCTLHFTDAFAHNSINNKSSNSVQLKRYRYKRYGVNKIRVARLLVREHFTHTRNDGTQRPDQLGGGRRRGRRANAPCHCLHPKAEEEEAKPLEDNHLPPPFHMLCDGLCLWRLSQHFESHN